MTKNRLSSLISLLGNKENYRLRPVDEPPGQVPLSKTCCKGKLKVCKIGGDRRLCARMANLGVLPGCEMELLCPNQGRQCLIKINGGTISLDEPSAQNIFVEPL